MRRWPWWVWAGVLLPFGFGAFAPLVPGVQRRKATWLGLGALGLAFVVTGIALLDDAAEDNSLSGFCFIAAWITSGATVLGIRQSFLEPPRPTAWERGKAAARTRLRQRREALALVTSDPALALELGVGRPDVAGAQHAGLVDVNHAPPAAIADLPGVDAALAERAVALREELNGFSGLADFGAVLDLDGNHVERLRERAVFLPR